MSGFWSVIPRQGRTLDSLGLLRNSLLRHAFGNLRSRFALLYVLLIPTHPPSSIVQVLVLALGEASRLVVQQELLSNRFPLLFLREAAHTTVDPPIVNNCPDLEVLGQLVTVVGLVEVLWEDLVPHLDGLEVHLELLCQLHFLHGPPLLASIRLSLLLTLLLLEFHVVKRLNLLCSCFN